MPFAVSCTACSARFLLGDDLFRRKVVGKIVTVRCRRCSAEISVDATEPTLPRDLDRPSQQPPARDVASEPGIVALSAGLLLLSQSSEGPVAAVVSVDVASEDVLASAPSSEENEANDAPPSSTPSLKSLTEQVAMSTADSSQTDSSLPDSLPQDSKPIEEFLLDIRESEGLVATPALGTAVPGTSVLDTPLIDTSALEREAAQDPEAAAPAAAMAAAVERERRDGSQSTLRALGVAPRSSAPGNAAPSEPPRAAKTSASSLAPPMIESPEAGEASRSTQPARRAAGVAPKTSRDRRVLLGFAAMGLAVAGYLGMRSVREPAHTSSASAEPAAATLEARLEPAKAAPEAPVAPSKATPSGVEGSGAGSAAPLGTRDAPRPVANRPPDAAKKVARAGAIAAPAQPALADTSSTAAKADDALTPAAPAVEFDRTAALAALSSAAMEASSCRKEGDPSGTASVTVSFAPSGRVTSANLAGPPFAGTATGGCIATTLRRVRVPPFSGERITVSRTIVVQ